MRDMKVISGIHEEEKNENTVTLVLNLFYNIMLKKELTALESTI